MNGKQAQVSNPCGTCDVNCCKEYTIYINAHDIYRIVTNFPLPTNRYLQAFETQNQPSGIMIRNRLRKKRFDLALKDTGDGCVFFNNKEALLHCSIHAFKPGVCKAYPFKLEGGQLVHSTGKKCPIDWKPEKEFNDSMVLHLVQYRKEWSFYYSLIDEWNSRIRLHRSLEYFLRFIFHKVQTFERASAQPKETLVLPTVPPSPYHGSEKGPVGLGGVVAWVAGKLGIEKCPGCQRRKKWLNKRIIVWRWWKK